MPHPAKVILEPLTVRKIADCPPHDETTTPLPKSIEMQPRTTAKEECENYVGSDAEAPQTPEGHEKSIFKMPDWNVSCSTSVTRDRDPEVGPRNETEPEKDTVLDSLLERLALQEKSDTAHHRKMKDPATRFHRLGRSWVERPLESLWRISSLAAQRATQWILQLLPYRLEETNQWK